MPPPTDADLDRLTRNEADIAFRRRVRTIMRWLPPGEGRRILDVPCGRGFYLERYLALDADALLTGVEFDPDLVAHAAAVVRGEVPVLCGAIEQLPFDDDAFDAAIVSEVLEHVDDDRSALVEVARVVRPGGLIAITVPHAAYPFWWDPINWLLERVSGRHIRTGPFAGIWANHVRLYRPAELRAAVVGAGLDVVDARSFTHRCIPFSHNLVYGLGKPLLERNLLPARLAAAGDRHRFDAPVSPWNPVAVAIRFVGWFDRRNRDDEPAGTTTVNLALLARVPGG